MFIALSFKSINAFVDAVLGYCDFVAKIKPTNILK